MRRRVAVVAAVLTAGCGGPGDVGVSAAPPPVAFENVGRSNHNYQRPEVADPTLNLDRTLTTRPRASRSKRAPAAGDVRRVSSTAYCLTGTMANGRRVYRGAVAMNGVPMGSVWQVDGGGTYTVADRIGHSSEFDIAMPGDCAGAIAYGRRVITVRRVR